MQRAEPRDHLGRRAGPPGSSRDALAGAESAERRVVAAAERGHEQHRRLRRRRSRRRRRAGASGCHAQLTRRRRAAPWGAGRRHRGTVSDPAWPSTECGARVRATADRARGAVLGERPVPRRRPRRPRDRWYDRRDERSGRPAAADPDPALDPARRPAAAVFFAWVFGQAAGSRGRPLPRRGADRAAPRPDRAHAREGRRPARPRGRARVPDVRRGARRRPSSRSAPSSSARRSRRRTGSTTISPSRTDRRQSPAYRDVDRLQHWLNTHHLRSIKIEKSGHRIVTRIQQRDVGRYTHRVVTFVEGAAISIGKALFDRCWSSSSRSTCSSTCSGSRAPSTGASRRTGGMPLICADRARARLVRARAAPAQPDHRRERRARPLHPRRHRARARTAEHYALVFGGWVALTEVLPYLGPWLGAIPPIDLRARRPPALGRSGCRSSSSGSTSSRATSSCRT